MRSRRSRRTTASSCCSTATSRSLRQTRSSSRTPSKSCRDELAKSLFRMSSELPEKLRGVAESKGVLAGLGARGMVFNADGAQMLLLIQMGTVGAQQAAADRVIRTDFTAPLLIDRVSRSETSSGDFWAMSMPFENDEAARTGDRQLRSLLVNKLSAARRLGDFVRGLWWSRKRGITA